MFSLHQITEASAKTKTGADFPRYIQDLRKIGVTEYASFVADGHTVFFGEEDFSLETEKKYPSLPVSANANPQQFEIYLRQHQQGGSDYLTFCKHAAETGVERWLVDIGAMTCTYFSKAGERMLSESIPNPATN